MSQLISLESIVIVEGKYDKITLENIIDATIITTNGFGIYKDKQKRELIKRLCEKNGAVIITDSDSAGAQIRSYIKSFCDSNRIINVYLPQIKGKERRKKVQSKEGYLGAEGMSAEAIIEALNRSGVKAMLNTDNSPKITKTDLYKLGFSGNKGSKSTRVDFCRFAGLPEGLSSNAFLDALNSLYSVESLYTEVKKWRPGQAKN